MGCVPLGLVLRHWRSSLGWQAPVHPELCREASVPVRFQGGLGVEWEKRWLQTDLCSDLGSAPHYLCDLRQVPQPL